MRIVGAVRQLDDRVPDYLQRFTQRRTGKRQDIVSFLKLPVVAVSAYCRIDYSAADGWRGIRGIVDKNRRAGWGRRLDVTQLSIGLKVQHVLLGCRWPFRQVAPLPSTCDKDADRAWPVPATGSGEMLCQPVKRLFHDDSDALGRDLDMGPRADSQTDIDAAAPQALVLLEIGR